MTRITQSPIRVPMLWAALIASVLNSQRADAQLKQGPAAADRSDERDFRRIAAILPGFAGYYYIVGTSRLVIAMSDNTPADSAIRTVRRIFGTRRNSRFGPPTFEVRRVKFSFTLLSNLRDKVEPRVLAVAGVESSDLDEEHDRLTFGISDGDAARLVSAIMKSAAAPAGSYGFEPDPSCFDAGGACRLDPRTPEQQRIVRDSFEVSLHVPAIVHLGDSVQLRITVRNLSSRGRRSDSDRPRSKSFDNNIASPPLC